VNIADAVPGLMVVLETPRGGLDVMISPQEAIGHIPNGTLGVVHNLVDAEYVGEECHRFVGVEFERQPMVAALILVPPAWLRDHTTGDPGCAGRGAGGRLR
jgi:hypothetical protein